MFLCYPPSIFRNFYPSQTGTLCPVNTNSLFPLPWPDSHPSALCLHVLTPRCTSNSGMPRSIWPFVLGLFLLALCPQGSSILYLVSDFPSFLRLNSIPLCVSATFRVSIHPLMGHLGPFYLWGAVNRLLRTWCADSHVQSLGTSMGSQGCPRKAGLLCGGELA